MGDAMTTGDGGAVRVPPLPEAERDDEVMALLRSTGWGDKATSDVLTTVVRHRKLFAAWVPFGGVLLHGSLPRRLREIAILRTAWRQGCAYEWAHHVGMGARAGLAEDEIADLARRDPVLDWPPLERAVVDAVDQLCTTSSVDDDTWQALAAELDDVQLVELPFLVGGYVMLGFALNSLGVTVPPDLPSLPSRPATLGPRGDAAATHARWLEANRAGDGDAQLSLYRDDVDIWQAWTHESHPLEDVRRSMRWMDRHVEGLRLENVRCTLTEDGWVQRHTMCGTSRDNGESFAVEACMVVTIDDEGRIARIEEFIDLGQLEPLLRR
jgi:4-carboxymuconolactone decarboxylase